MPQDIPLALYRAALGAYVLPMTSPSLAPDKPCPLCGKPSLAQFRPFCSKRCADIDLHRWLSGAYAIPAEESSDEDERPGDAGAGEPD